MNRLMLAICGVALLLMGIAWLVRGDLRTLIDLNMRHATAGPVVDEPITLEVDAMPNLVVQNTMGKSKTGTWRKSTGPDPNDFVEMNWEWDCTPEDWARILADWQFICDNLP